MKVQIPYSEESRESAPPPCRELYSAGLGWLVPEEQRPPDWQVLEQPKDYVEQPKKRFLMPSGTAPRPLRRSEIAKRKVKPSREPGSARVKREGGRGQAWASRADITLEVITKLWDEGLNMTQMAHRLSCCHSLINRRLVDARRDSPEFREIEKAYVTCPQCQKPKFQFSRLCCFCLRAAGERNENPRYGAWNRKLTVTIEAIMECWREHLRAGEVAKKLNCSYKLVTARVEEAKKDPELAAQIADFHKCACGRAKSAPKAQCYNCNRRDKMRRAGAAGSQSEPESAVSDARSAGRSPHQTDAGGRPPATGVCEMNSQSTVGKKLSDGENNCMWHGHDYQELIDPRSGGFMRCKKCGKEVDCEDQDNELESQ